MADRNVIIIGAGIAGLAAGCYLQMNGYPTTILEMGATPGGLCTSWRRDGFTFDGCIQWLLGATHISPLHQYWLEVGALRDGKIARFTEYKRTEYAPGEHFSLFTDADWLSAEMLRIAPEDQKLIEELIHAIKRAARGRIPAEKAFELFTPFDWLKTSIQAAPLASVNRKYGKTTVKEFAERFRSPVFRENFADMMGLYDDYPMAILIMMAGWMHAGGVGYPVGGSLVFARTIETHFRRLGGTVRYQSRVRRILTENGRAIGVELENGDKRRADIVISAADGYDTLFRMLDGQYLDADSAARFGWDGKSRNGGGVPDLSAAQPQGRLFEPLLQVSIGVDKLLRETAHTVRRQLDRPIRIDDTHMVTSLDTTIYNFDASLAMPGKTTVVVRIRTDYDYWTRLAAEDAERYEEEKARIGREVVRALDSGTAPASGAGDPVPFRTPFFPGFEAAVECIDVMTPATAYRMTNNHRASHHGWFPTTDTFRKRISKTLPGLTGFYRIGQWTVPGGGLPGVLLTGRHVAQIICRQDGRRFTIRT